MNVRSRNRVRISGRPGAPLVVLAHGFRVRSEHVAVVPALERDFTVVLFDHVGSGRSDLSAWSKERYSSLERARIPRRSHGLPLLRIGIWPFLAETEDVDRCLPAQAILHAQAPGPRCLPQRKRPSRRS